MTARQSHALTTRQRRQALYVLVPTCVLVAVSFAVARLASAPFIAKLFDNIHWTIAYIGACMLAWLGVRWADVQHAAPRRWFAYGMSSYLLGQICWDIQVAIDWNPFPAPSDIFFWSMGMCSAYGMLLTYRNHQYRDGQPPQSDRTMLLDAVSFAVMALTVVLALYLPLRGDFTSWELIILIAYPVSMFAAVCIGAIMIPTLKLKFSWSWLLLFVAFIVNGVIWMQWNAEVLAGTITDGSWLNLWFSLTAIAIGSGTVLWRVETSSSSAWERRCEGLLRMQPLLVVCVAALSVGLVWSLPRVSEVVAISISISAAVMGALAIIRQSLLLYERDRLLAAEHRASELEAQLRQSQKMEAIGTLASGIAHDFNNILSVILGNIDLASIDGNQPQATWTSLQQARKAVHRARDLISRIVGFARPQESTRQSLQLADVVEDALILIRAIMPSTVTIRCSLPKGLPLVSIDSSQIFQVLMNLCTNACQAMVQQRGEIEIGLSACTAGAALRDSSGLSAGPYLCLCVKDNGVGIDPAIAARIFEPFFTTKPSGQGSGLGLSMVNSIMRAHGGAITMSSTPGRGAEFDIYLPALVTAATLSDQDSGQRLAASGGNGQHILCVDDEEALVFLLSRLLERLGYRVSGYTDAPSALAAVRDGQQQFDLIITDFSMPGMSGIAFAGEVMRLQPLLPIVLISGYIEKNDIERARKAGVRAVLLKPDSVDELAKTIHSLLSTDAIT